MAWQSVRFRLASSKLHEVRPVPSRETKAAVFRGTVVVALVVEVRVVVEMRVVVEVPVVVWGGSCGCRTSGRESERQTSG